ISRSVGKQDLKEHTSTISHRIDENDDKIFTNVYTCHLHGYENIASSKPTDSKIDESKTNRSADVCIGGETMRFQKGMIEPSLYYGENNEL
ncbi:hypothetical protein NPIL_36621, partial [Nephila pilipes]